MWIEREIRSTLETCVSQRPVVVLTGARQSGKSSLLASTFPAYPTLSLDLPSNAQAAETMGGVLLEQRPPPLILDEVQYAPSILRHVKARVDTKRQTYGQYLITGSQKFQLMRGVTESLAGRAAVLSLHSLSAREVAKHWGRSLEGDFLLEAIWQGGYPEVHASGVPPERFFTDYVATYLERDVRQALAVKNLRAFDSFMRMLALRSGQLLKMSAVASELGLSATTIKSWIDILEGSNIITLLPPFFSNPAKRLVKTPKLYFLDTGLLCFLLGLTSSAEMARSPLLGAIFETHVMGQLVRHFSNQGRVPALYFYRDHDGYEVDFVIAKGTQVHAMEVKWSEAPNLGARGFEALRRAVKTENVLSRTLITPSPGYYLGSQGVGRGDSLHFEYLDPERGQ